MLEDCAWFKSSEELQKKKGESLSRGFLCCTWGKSLKDQVILSGVERNAEMQDEISLKEAEHKVFLLLQGFVQGSTEKAQCKVGLQPTGMDSRVEPKQMGDSIKVNARSSWASVIKLWALLIAVF